MRKVDRPSEPNGRVRFLSDAERGALLNACTESKNPWLHTVVLLALSTGMRKGELMNLRWPDVDLPNGRITLRETKNGETRVVPLVGPASEAMKAHAKVRRMDTDLVFPAPAKPPKPVKPMDFRGAWEAALKRAEVADFHFHDLRHSCASYLAMGGASLAEIAEVLGHKTLAMVKRYSHLSDSHVAGVVERMNRAIFGEG